MTSMTGVNSLTGICDVDVVSNMARLTSMNGATRTTVVNGVHLLPLLIICRCQLDGHGCSYYYTYSP